MTYKNPVCKGAYALGTACGKCERCEENRPKENTMDKNLNMNALDNLIRALEGRAIGSVYGVTVTRLKHIRADLAYQKQPEMKDNDACFSENGNNAVSDLESFVKLVNLKANLRAKNIEKAWKDIQTLRTALEQAKQDRKAVRDLELALYKYMSAGYKEKRKEAADFAKAVKKTHAEAIKRAEEN